MIYSIRLSSLAVSDLEGAVEYYNTQQSGLGTRFAIEVNDAFVKISKMPNVYSKRYQDVRAAKVRSFPYLVFYDTDEKKFAINVLRIFNTHQKPYY